MLMDRDPAGHSLRRCLAPAYVTGRKDKLSFHRGSSPGLHDKNTLGSSLKERERLVIQSTGALTAS